MADMTKPDGTLMAGTCDAILKVPPGWDEIAITNWQALQQDMATRKSHSSDGNAVLPSAPKPSGN